MVRTPGSFIFRLPFPLVVGCASGTTAVEGDGRQLSAVEAKNDVTEARFNDRLKPRWPPSRRSAAPGLSRFDPSEARA